MAGQEEQSSRKPATYDVSRVIKQVRHRQCNARLFDARQVWKQVPAREALIILKCRRCGEFVCLAPEQSGVKG